MGMDLIRIINEIIGNPYAKNDPRGYKQLVCEQRISLDDALAKVGMTYDEVCQFNFGPSADPDLEYAQCFEICESKLMWERNKGGIQGLSGWSGSYIWVPGDCVITGPNTDGAKFDNYTKRADKETDAGMDVPPLASGKEYYAARSQFRGIWATSTVDTGFKAGDILLSHIEKDNFISKVTLSWPTHAGIALNELWAVDADRKTVRGDFAVAPIRLKDFFLQKEPPPNTPGLYGGLVYRYIGKPGDKEEDVEKVRHDAAVWAKRETWNKYKFVLKRSHIVSKKIGQLIPKKMKVEEKEFDAGGEAVDKDGKRLTYSKMDIETELQAIYCSEFVWRAYRTGAGVNIVDPKKLINILKDSSHAVATILRWQIADERKEENYMRDAKVNPISPTAKQLRGLSVLKKIIPTWLLRKIILSYMKKEFNAYLCAPFQLAQTKLTERIVQLTPFLDTDYKGDSLYDVVEVADFRKQNVHPYEALQALSKGNSKDSFEAGWNEYKNNNAMKAELSLDKPWADSPEQTSAPELKVGSEDENQPYNTQVNFTDEQPNPPFMV